MFNRIKLLFRTFTPVEVCILTEVQGVLPPAAKHKFVNQIKQINKVQRYLDWTEINFYPMKRNKIDWDPSLAFNNHRELKLAQIEFSIQNVQFEATLFAVNGHIFSLVIRPSIKRYCFAQKIRVESCRLIADPESESILDKPEFPASYLEWLKTKKEQTMNGWRIYHLQDCYCISLRSGDFWVLAERDGEFLFTSDDSGNIEFYHMEHSDAHPVSVGKDFGKALKYS